MHSRKGFLRLDMNEGVPGLPDDFIKMVAKKINSKLLSMYPEYDGLEKKIAKINKLDSENILLSNGSDAAIKYIFDAYVSGGDKVLIVEPGFAMYAVYCEMFNARAITLKYKNDLSFPIEEFKDRITPDLKLSVIINPNSPTGTILKSSELVSIIQKTAKNNVLLIVDEAYFPFYPKTVITAIKKYPNLIVLRTFSKLFGMAGLRLGYAAANPQIIENSRKVRPGFDINSLAVLFAEELMLKPGIIEGLINEFNAAKVYLINRLAKEGMVYRDSRANFVLIPCRGRVNEVMKELERKKILVSGGFRHNSLKDYIRVSVANRQMMGHFLDIFISIWKRKKRR